jgi:pimeloyl-ACP methyl ester carboxylesterase
MPILQLDEADLFYETHGDGPPLLLISGTACDGEFWKPYQVPEFSRDHTVITFDQRGTGKTTTRGNDYSTRRLAADAAQLIEHIGLGPAIVLGHSMGGRVAQFLPLDHPSSVKRLILASTGASFRARGGIPPSICLGIIKLGYERYIREHSIEIGFSKDFIKAHPDRVAQCVDLILGCLPPIEVYFAQVMSRMEHDTSARLKDIQVPTLVTVGGDEGHGTPDTTHLASSEFLAKSIPNAKFVVLPGHGHFYMFSDPETTNRLVREFIADEKHAPGDGDQGERARSAKTAAQLHAPHSSDGQRSA